MSTAIVRAHLASLSTELNGLNGGLYPHTTGVGVRKRVLYRAGKSADATLSAAIPDAIACLT